MLKLSAAFGAKWRSAFGQRDLSYNERIWTIAEELHTPEDVLFGLVDESDGSSFVLRVEYLDEDNDLSDDDIENALLAPFCDPAFGAEYLGPCSIEVSDLRFFGGVLAIINPKFGNQIVQIMFRRAGDTVTMLQFTWPDSLDKVGHDLPIKHRSLLQGLTL